MPRSDPDSDESQQLSASWASSGAAGLSGRADGQPLDVPQRLVRVVERATAAIRAHSQRVGRVVELDGPALLGERAALAGLSRRGSTSCGGAARLLRAGDGWIALSLARESDVASLGAWLDGANLPGEVDDELWEVLGRLVMARTVDDLVHRAALLAMPIGGLGEVVAPADADDGAVVTRTRGTSQTTAESVGTAISDLVVVDLSSLWAGPLCADILGQAGARVIKVESVLRRDGARAGTPAFFDLLHGGHESVCLDFGDDTDRAALRRLIRSADIVIEASRPRALAQLGIDANDVGGAPIWLSITAHGATDATAVRVGFGDDAAVAGGLVTNDAAGPCFCADAIADPLTGLAAAAAVLDCVADGGRWRIDASLSRTASFAAGGPVTDLTGLAIMPPRARPVRSAAAPLGQHTDSVLAEFG